MSAEWKWNSSYRAYVRDKVRTDHMTYYRYRLERRPSDTPYWTDPPVNRWQLIEVWSRGARIGSEILHVFVLEPDDPLPVDAANVMIAQRAAENI